MTSSGCSAASEGVGRRGASTCVEEDGWTRLVVRGSGGAVGHAAFDIPHFVMEQKMMRGIRDRAEQMRRDEVNAFVRREYRQRSRLQQPRQIVVRKRRYRSRPVGR